MTNPDPALVERALSAWESVYEGQCEVGSPRWTDNREAAMAAAVEAILAALRESGRLVEWRPIAEAPKDGTYVILAGPSGYITTPLRAHVGHYDAEYRPLDPWQTHSDDSFCEDGEPPTCWMALPATAATESSGE